jgi:hypothetical protein
MVTAPKMVKNAEKVDLITQLYDCRGERAGHILSRLIPIMIQDLRELNDTASIEEIPRNQGRIDALKELLFYVENGIGNDRGTSKPYY